MPRSFDLKSGLIGTGDRKHFILSQVESVEQLKVLIFRQPLAFLLGHRILSAAASLAAREESKQDLSNCSH
ncbi:hypothetical protein PMIT1313_01908 [Prochlorococcus marinus str. MIT 1313]|nr:hypothetical protein PMIT1313_01908 [Prochlorococcus marinus str. MIT 1313]KZR71467.1 hypothetical protein PMIT1318_02619 [Prochlorococcus marinus str. MIT 1318]